eukprot:TRINITY_DN43575_c0_g1_i1.p1 TRINITY_DN43575_c0_g1~~TRINITY_DN43575_c0_g1_i1.p1  ORF type:complete len:216 (-),score=32.83 TRINITY_DN43575_c0_g1_i1:51-644(-)
MPYIPCSRTHIRIRQERDRAEAEWLEAKAKQEHERSAALRKERRREEEAEQRAADASRQRLAAQIRALPRGQVMALADRTQGDNGHFAKGDVGVGRFSDMSFVEILWPNRTRTRTQWPNVSWYAGNPISLDELALGSLEGWEALSCGLSDTSTTCGDGMSSLAEMDMYEIADFLVEEECCSPQCSAAERLDYGESER